jgi:hypothetical protein
MCGVHQRAIYRIFNESTVVSLQLVDKILTGLDLVHLFHYPPDAGGFSDVYEHPAVMGQAA